MPDRSFVLLVNTQAGSAERDAVGRAAEVLRRVGEVTVEETGASKRLAETLEGVRDRTLVVAGGDGSLHVVANGLHRAERLGDVTVGIVPLGTGNDLARGLGLPLDAEAAALVVATGRERVLDVLVDDADEIAVNAVHAGLGAEAADLSAGMKDDLGPLAYPVGALVAGVRESGWDLRVEADGTPVASEERVLMVGIVNAPTIGGGTPLCPVAKPDDGSLDVILVTATGPGARVAFGAALRNGTHLDRDDVVHVRARKVRVTGDPVRYNADGELSDQPVADRSLEVLHHAWRVIVPGGWGTPDRSEPLA